MRNLIISLCIVGLFLEISGLIWSSKKEKPSDTFLKLSEPPARSIENPLENGYFLLLGFASSPSSHPVQVGYDVWLESDTRPSQRGFDLDKPGRTELRIPVALDQLLPEWNSPDPTTEFQRRDALFRTSVTRYSTLLSRYEQWLRMRFEDWGYAHRGVPRVEEILGTHRLYIAEGFGQQSRIGLERLAAELARWRVILRDARTLSMKILAQVILEDDVQLLSRILSRTTVDRAILSRGLNLLQPLTPSEYSLRWPVQSQFVLGYVRNLESDRELLPQDNTDGASKESLARAANLHPEMFRAVEHPRLQNVLGFSSSTQRTWDTYATFYDATIKAADSVHSPLPTLYDVARHSQLTLLERIVNPLEFSPNWEPFSQRLVETDARLRLVSLQILMRKPTATVTLPTRLAEVGSMYFDPFTGLPMLWSPTQKKLYSVGKDGLDDGGDPTFDISVPLAITMDSSPSKGTHAFRR
ncbi:MAG: hypothetical protein HY038_11925 [Nitrospirae bacterium]|nr:hypothetical protein [Nitrospirota bacterium]